MPAYFLRKAGCRIDVIFRSEKTIRTDQLARPAQLTVIDADRIVVMEAGRLVESGTYAELMALDGRFSRLASRQLA
jgi:hypothetical protein